MIWICQGQANIVAVTLAEKGPLDFRLEVPCSDVSIVVAL
jgi:hypothetical protein